MKHRPETKAAFNRSYFWYIAVVFLTVFVFPDVAFAAGEDGKLPYEGGLRTFQESLEGPVPFAISLVGIVACGAMLIFGGEISGFMRTMIFIVLVISIIVQAGNVVELMGGTGSLTGKTAHAPAQAPIWSVVT